MKIGHGSNFKDEIGEFMLMDRSAPPVYKLAEYLIQNSTLDVGRSMLDVHSLLA